MSLASACTDSVGYQLCGDPTRAGLSSLSHGGKLDGMNWDEFFRLDSVRPFRVREKQAFLHEDHRWTLPLLWRAQEDKLLPRPCRAVVFDRHHDAHDPRDGEFEEILLEGESLDRVLRACAEVLSGTDNDWIVGGIRLGLLSGVVVLGVEQSGFPGDCLEGVEGSFVREITTGARTAEIHLIPELPSALIGNQGRLSDRLHFDERLSKLLGWSLQAGGILPANDPFLLDIDLDCFSMHCRGYSFCWPDKVFWKELGDPIDSAPPPFEGWTGAKFIQHLLGHAGLLTIARESKWCGGESDCETIVARLNEIVFETPFLGLADPCQTQTSHLDRPIVDANQPRKTFSAWY